jgi:tRNA(fMet)-specific endonuclease VapC
MNGWGQPSERLTVQERNTIKTFQRLETEMVYMSEASLGELLYGVARSSKKEYNRRKLEVLLSAIPPLPIVRAVWEIYGETKAELSNRGKTIPDMDLLIAASAKCYELTLVANDKHMKNLPDSFPWENWAKP